MTYVARANDNPIGVHVFRYPPRVGERDAFLADAITMTQDPRSGRNTQLVEEANCQV